MNKELLPPNATQLERDLASTVSVVSDIDQSKLSTLWNPDTCDASLLPWLAWGLNVDYWNSAWSTAVKREYLKQHIKSRRIRGTAGAIKNALASLNMDITLTEWWQEEPPGTPYTFTIDVDLTSEGISAETQAEIDDIVIKHKNVRSRLNVINIYQPVAGDAICGSAMLLSEVVTVYPTWWTA